MCRMDKAQWACIGLTTRQPLTQTLPSGVCTAQNAQKIPSAFLTQKANRTQTGAHFLLNVNPTRYQGTRDVSHHSPYCVLHVHVFLTLLSMRTPIRMLRCTQYSCTAPVPDKYPPQASYFVHTEVCSQTLNLHTDGHPGVLVHFQYLGCTHFLETEVHPGVLTLYCT